MTEEYSCGYQEGYQEGWNAAVDEYAKDKAMAQPARESLTPSQIADFVGTHEFGPDQLKWFRLGEEAHGIAAAPEKGN